MRDPNTGNPLHVFTPWKREYNWRYEVRQRPDSEAFMVWDKRINKPVVLLAIAENLLTEPMAIEIADKLNKAYFLLYPHKVMTLVSP